jgi:hypothetical protein
MQTSNLLSTAHQLAHRAADAYAAGQTVQAGAIATMAVRMAGAIAAANGTAIGSTATAAAFADQAAAYGAINERAAAETAMARAAGAIMAVGMRTAS